jgi:hypothetical protein
VKIGLRPLCTRDVKRNDTKRHDTTPWPERSVHETSADTLIGFLKVYRKSDTAIN